MKDKNKIITFTFVTIIALLAGCASPTPSANIKPLTGENSALDLSKYRIASVIPFDTQSAGVKDPVVGGTFARDLAWRLKNSYGPLFARVNEGSSGQGDDEVIVTGKLTTYNAGNRDVRELIGLGLGAASFDGSFIVKDASDQHIIFRSEFSKLWAWGGARGGSRGVEDLEAATVIAMANTIALGKHWNPPDLHGDEHPKFGSYRGNLPPLTPDRSRIWIYRPSRIVGSAASFQVRVDGVYAGTAYNGGFFCINVEPGHHDVSEVALPKISTASLDVAGGGETYVKVPVPMGSLPKPEPVSESAGADEIKGLHLKGN